MPSPGTKLAFLPREIETLGLDELVALPGGEAIALKLLHELLFEHLKAKGLQIEYDRRVLITRVATNRN